MATIQRKYNIGEYSNKVSEALKKLSENQQPGHVEQGGKADVIEATKNEIKAMLDQGYTSQQIADALKNDVFGILPKTITEIVLGKKQNNKRTKNVQDNKMRTKLVTSHDTDKQKNTAISSVATFPVKPDNKDI